MTHPPRSQRGVGTVIATLLLLTATLLVLLVANRQLLLELRLSANQARAAEAFEASEAGLEWAGAMLNSPAALAAECRPAAGAGETFRARHLAIDAGGIAPRTWLDGATPTPLQPRCDHDGIGWHCSCPAGAAPAAAAASGPSFTLRFAATGRPGVVRVVAEGAGPPDAVARSEALLALQPALPVPPATSLTLRAPALPADAFFAGHFGLSRAAWAAQPMVHRLACRGDCGAALLAAVGIDVQRPLVHVEGDLLLRGPLVLGRADRPVLIVVAGRLQIEGAVSLHGAVYAAEIGWNAPAGALRGALISEGGAAGAGALDLVHDAAALDLLRTRHGSFVRVPGSWRDF
jgi:hypothetical protein